MESGLSKQRGLEYLRTKDVVAMSAVSDMVNGWSWHRASKTNGVFGTPTYLSQSFITAVLEEQQLVDRVDSTVLDSGPRRSKMFPTWMSSISKGGRRAESKDSYQSRQHRIRDRCTFEQRVQVSAPVVSPEAGNGDPSTLSSGGGKQLQQPDRIPRKVRTSGRLELVVELPRHFRFGNNAGGHRLGQ